VKQPALTPAELEIVRGILARLVPDREVRAFGSRISGPVKKFSDLDLAVMGESPLASSLQADLEEAFRESDLPFKVDVVDWATTQESFRKIIEQDFVVVQSGKGTERERKGESKQRNNVP
jgi:type I restriction enzyme S subunit